MEPNIFQRMFASIVSTLRSLFSNDPHEKPIAEIHEHGTSQPTNDLGTNNAVTLSNLDLSKFHKIDTEHGSGDEAFAGAEVSVHYTGWLIDPSAADLKGIKFDSSVDRGQTFNFPLGAGHVIKGWDEGFEGMKIGGKRTLLIPPEMGYGARGAGGVIPPNASLMFEVSLLAIN